MKTLKTFENYERRGDNNPITYDVTSTSYYNKALEGYLGATLWTEEERLEEEHPDFDIAIINVHPNTKREAYQEIKKFVDENAEIIERINMEPSQLGHDLWLTRNGHGVGFWDRNLGEDGDILSEKASELKEKHVFILDKHIIIE